MLPLVKHVKMPSLTLPTAWQTVIFRNYGYVSIQRLAEVLECDVDTVEREAERLGLPQRDYSKDFERYGYITVIRNNWFLLPYDQLILLLGIDEKKLDFILENDDFLAVKLGGFKPECRRITYAPLNERHAELTREIAKNIAKHSSKWSVRPFDFPERRPNLVAAEERENVYHVRSAGKRIVHGYLSPCGDAFAGDCADTLTESLLEKYREVGVNGIWLHGLLSALSPYPFLPSLSEGYRQRRSNLAKIIERCKKYGISVYLYMNEPRALPTGALPEYEKLIGWQEKRTLCLSHSEVKDYLYFAVRDLCESVPELGGIFTITMSENPTHCNFLPQTECPICKGVLPEESAAEVNNIFFKAMRDSGCGGELIANLWGWSPYMGWKEEQIWRGIELLDKDISVMCVSEYDLEIEKGGVASRVIDYSISNPGPSEITKKIADVARKHGHRVYGKIQASNSWECAAVPYIPVFDLVHEHVSNLREIGVNDLFLTWTQGGYPSPSISLASSYNCDLDEWYKNTFGKVACSVHTAVKQLCRAFRQYPFSVTSLYLSPHTLGAANLWDMESEGKSSTMVCFAYDDLDSWVAPYGEKVYLSQYRKLLRDWERGISMLKDIQTTPEVRELLTYAKVVYCHFYSDYYQTEFAGCKRIGDREGMLLCVRKERVNTIELLSLMSSDARIGYEASNHYFYTERNLVEKIIRMESFEKILVDGRLEI